MIRARRAGGFCRAIIQVCSCLPMPDLPSNPGLGPSLRRLVRGLSALFWGLPATLLVFCTQAVHSDVLRVFGIVPVIVTTVWLLFGLWQLGQFQRQERIWIRVLERARLLALVIAGLAPFLYWSSQRPAEAYYTRMSLLLFLCSLVFLGELNVVIRRLAAMLPDETLRAETRQLTTLNRVLLLLALALLAVFFSLDRLAFLPPEIIYRLQMAMEKIWLPGFVLLILLPLSVTMALLWKAKEAILEGVFTAKK
jgi:hypothetical protein